MLKNAALETTDGAWRKRKNFGLEPTLCAVKTREARGDIRVCADWIVQIVQTVRANRIAPESVAFGVVIKNKAFQNETLLSFFIIHTTPKATRPRAFFHAFFRR